MMKILKTTINIVLYLIIGLLLISSLGSVLMDRPVILTAISSDSMAPVFERGDMVAVWALTGEALVEPNDIVIFSSESGRLANHGWIIHRVIEGNVEEGYITHGDNNEYTDQELSDAPPIKREWMVSRAVTLRDRPIVLPFIGYLALWFESIQRTVFFLPGLITLLAGIIGYSVFVGDPPRYRRRRKGKKHYFGEQLLFILSGLTLMVALSATMMISSEIAELQYEVNETGEPTSTAGPGSVLLLGESKEMELSKLSNQGFFPLAVTVITRDPQLSLSEDSLTLSPNEERTVMLHIEGSSPGVYASRIWMGLFLPLLPSPWIYALAERSFFLALLTISLIPALPLMLFPFVDQRLRNKTKKGVKKSLRKIQRALRV